MNFAHVENGAVLAFFPQLPLRFKGVRALADRPASELAALGLLPVVNVSPAFDPLLTRFSGAPLAFTVFADHVDMVIPTEPIPPEEIAARQVREALLLDPRAVELRDKLTTATAAQISDYVDAQVTDLPSARLMFKRVLLVMALMAR